MPALGLGQAAAYRRVAALIDAGLLERLDLLRGEPALIRATRAGLRYAGLGMAPAIVSPGSVDHWLRCASVALDLEARHGAGHVLTERELLVAERHEERPIASARIGELPNGGPRLHRPDLVVLPTDHPLVRLHPEGLALNTHPSAGNRTGGPGEDDGVFSVRGRSEARAGRAVAAHPRTRDHRADERIGPGLAAHARTREQAREIPGDDERARAGAEDMGVVAIEVELTPKSPKRLREIIRGWRSASWVAEVHYLCEPGQTRRAVERAVEKLHASDRIRVADVPRRADRQEVSR
ncbi:MAG: hypothetical protein JST08_01305 [Actinobacteria bacterium]|nr:hypothetical protein [Actinomycetota bacterium]